MEEEPRRLLDQKEFSSASEIAVWHLHFPTANWKTMCRLLVFSLLADHDSVNVKKGRTSWAQKKVWLPAMLCAAL